MNSHICSSYPELPVHKSWRWNVCNTFICDYISPFSSRGVCVCVSQDNARWNQLLPGTAKRQEEIIIQGGGKCALPLLILNQSAACRLNATKRLIDSASTCHTATEKKRKHLRMHLGSFSAPDEVPSEVMPFVAINGWMAGDWHLAEGSTSSVNSATGTGERPRLILGSTAHPKLVDCHNFACRITYAVTVGKLQKRMNFRDNRERNYTSIMDKMITTPYLVAIFFMWYFLVSIKYLVPSPL